jgi:plastocyanin
MAYSPRTGYFYATASDRPSSCGSAPAWPWDRRSARATPALSLLIDSRTNKIVWQKKMPYSVGQGSGALATASGLVFHGDPDGNFQAYDDKTGELLWQWQTGAGADAPAITYEIDGTQYVAIAAGGVSIQTIGQRRHDLGVFAERLARQPAASVRSAAAAADGGGSDRGRSWQTNAVTLIDYSFTPNRITVPAGTKVIFTNNGKQFHNAASSDDGGWDTGMLGSGKSARRLPSTGRELIRMPACRIRS